MTRFIFTLIITLSFFTISKAQVSIDDIRIEFYQVQTEKELNHFINKVQKCSDPKAIAYLASSFMWKAEYAFLPTTKLSFFNKGKKLLENLISQYPDMIEAYYIRALLKSQSPKFLGYHHGYHSDLEFVKNNLNASDLPKEYKAKITSVLKEYKLL